MLLFLSGKWTIAHCHVQILKKTSGLSLQSRIMWPDLFGMRSLFDICIISVQGQPHAKGKWHLISHSIFSRHLVPKKRIMLARKVPWLLPNLHNIFLNSIANKVGSAKRSGNSDEVIFDDNLHTTLKSISIKQL